MKYGRLLLLILIPAQCWSDFQFSEIQEIPAGCAAAFVLRNKQARSTAQGLRDMASKVEEDKTLLPEGFSGTLYEVSAVDQRAPVLHSETCDHLEHLVLRTAQMWTELSPAQRSSLVDSWATFLRA